MLTPLADHIADFRRIHPDIEIGLVDMYSSQQWEALTSGRIDVALTREIRPSAEIASRLVLRDALFLVVPQEHRLAGEAGPVPLSAVAGEPFVLFRQAAAPALHAEILAACASAGFALRVEREAGDWPTILSLAAHGFGITLAPGCIRTLGFPRLVFLPLRDVRAVANIFLCHRSGRLSPATQSFVDFIQARTEPA